MAEGRRQESAVLLDDAPVGAVGVVRVLRFLIRKPFVERWLDPIVGLAFFGLRETELRARQSQGEYLGPSDRAAFITVSG